MKPEMSDDDKKVLDEMFKAVLPQGNDYLVEARNLGENGAAVLITQNEFMRRYREMSSIGGGMNFYGSMPESYNIIVNMQNPLVARIWGREEGSSRHCGSRLRGRQRTSAPGGRPRAARQRHAQGQGSRRFHRPQREAARKIGRGAS